MDSTNNMPRPPLRPGFSTECPAPRAAFMEKADAMSYAEQQRDPRGLTIGLGAVVVFHILLGYGLANGLGRKVIEVLKAPLDVSLIEPVKPAPPPPPPPPPKPRVVKAAPKVAPPPPAYVPPVETPVVPPPQPVIAATSPEPPPPAPPAPVPAAPPVVDIAVTCSNHVAVRSSVVYPPQAERLGLSGDVVVDFTVAPDGSIKNVAVSRSSNSVFNAAATAAVAKLKCTGQAQDVRVRVPFAFRLDA